MYMFLINLIAKKKKNVSRRKISKKNNWMDYGIIWLVSMSDVETRVDNHPQKVEERKHFSVLIIN